MKFLPYKEILNLGEFCHLKCRNLVDFPVKEFLDFIFRAGE